MEITPSAPPKPDPQPLIFESVNKLHETAALDDLEKEEFVPKSFNSSSKKAEEPVAKAKLTEEAFKDSNLHHGVS